MHPNFLLTLSALAVDHARGIVGQSLGLSPDAQMYKVTPLPDVRFPIPQSWAGDIPILGRGDDKLFFWLFAAESNASSGDLIIWLNGGPGCASTAGLMTENGPVYFPGNATTPQYNPSSWTKLANVLYIDQPVGTGFSQGSDQASTNHEATEDFVAVLTKLLQIFPSLRSKNTHIMGESWAGIYIPYFADAIIKSNLTIKLRSLSIGDGTMGNAAASTSAVITQYIQQNQNILQVPQNILDEFVKGGQKCGLSGILSQATYPPKGKIYIESDPEGQNYKHRRQALNSNYTLPANYSCGAPTIPAEIDYEIDYCGGGIGPAGRSCAVYSAALDYLYTVKPCFSQYNIKYNCNNAGVDEDLTDFTNYLNQPALQAAIHVNKTFEDCNQTIQYLLGAPGNVPPPPAYDILPRLLRNVQVHLYSGDLDILLNHLGTELVIQNMTWNGGQGLSNKPNMPFFSDGIQSGTWGCGRGLTYHLFHGAGHAVPHDKPREAFAFVRDFVVGTYGYLGVDC